MPLPPAVNMKLWIAIDPSIPKLQVLAMCAQCGFRMAELVNVNADDASELHCVNFRDADGRVYPSILWHDVTIFQAQPNKLRRFVSGFLDEGLPTLVQRVTDVELSVPDDSDSAYQLAASFGPADSPAMRRASRLSDYNPPIAADWSLDPTPVEKMESMILIDSRMSPSGAAKVCSRLGVSAWHEAQALGPASWSPKLVCQQALSDVFSEARRLQMPTVAYLKTMEIGEAKFQLENTALVASADHSFAAVAVVTSQQRVGMSRAAVGGS